MCGTTKGEIIQILPNHFGAHWKKMRIYVKLQMTYSRDSIINYDYVCVCSRTECRMSAKKSPNSWELARCVCALLTRYSQSFAASTLGPPNDISFIFRTAISDNVGVRNLLRSTLSHMGPIVHTLSLGWWCRARSFFLSRNSVYFIDVHSLSWIVVCLAIAVT